LINLHAVSNREQLLTQVTQLDNFEQKQRNLSKQGWLMTHLN